MAKFSQIFLFIFGFSQSIYSQQNILKDLSFYGDVMIHANTAEHRIVASEKFVTIFEEVLSEPNSYEVSLNEIKWISQIKNSNDDFRVYTWQVDLGDFRYETHGYIHTSENKFFKLSNLDVRDMDHAFMELDADNWDGHIYYHIEPMAFQNDSIYLLFGFDANSEFNKRKVIEVLSFNQGVPLFGKAVFKYEVEGSRDIIKNRINFEYSSDAVMSVNYNSSMNMIVFDHLADVIGNLPGQGPTKVPDGTYEGFVLVEETWVYNEKLFHEIMDEAPRPKPILDKRSKNIMGKKNKKR